MSDCKLLGFDQAPQERAHGGSVVPADGERQGVEQAPRQLEGKPRRALIPDAMLERIDSRAVLLGSGRPLRMERVLDGYVVNLMPPAQLAK